MRSRGSVRTAVRFAWFGSHSGSVRAVPFADRFGWFGSWQFAVRAVQARHAVRFSLFVRACLVVLFGSFCWEDRPLRVQARLQARAVLPIGVSVFPVPAGPAGAPPRHIPSACDRVMYARSVKGVITSRSLHPRYSWLY